MKYVLTDHAKTRMIERSLSKSLLDQVLHEPTKVVYDNRGRLMFKKLYAGRRRLLLVVGEMSGDTLKVITIIDTSKVKKYL